MDSDKRGHLKLVYTAEEQAEGPITRLGLHRRFNSISPKQIAFSIATKVALLAMVLYFIYR